MSQSEESRPRPRWFQFDLRLLFVLIAIVGVILAFEVARRSRKVQRKLLDTLSAGDSVYVIRGDAGAVTICYSSSFVRGSQGTITEIGEDFVTIRIDADDTEWWIPLSRISRVLRELPSASSAAKTVVPTKTPSKTSDPPSGNASDPLIRKTNDPNP